MKKYLYTLFLCALAMLAYAQDPAYPPSPAPPLHVTAAEYFVDTDPGAGLATPIVLTPGMNINNLNAAVNVNGLSIGIHHLYIRTRNAESAWSITQTREFLYDQDYAYTAPPPARQQVVAAEYFIDTDPGAGNGTAIAFTPGTDLNNLPVAVNINGLSNGIHHLYLRTKSAEGRWSITQVKDFQIDFDPVYPAAPVAAQNIIAAEYFFDTDPGTGNGISIPIAAGTNLSNLPATINTAALTIGTHRLYLRTKGQEGHWSITQVKELVVDADFNYPVAPVAPQNIVAAEYFIDTDPGMGHGTAIAITPGLDLSDIAANVTTAGLPLGTHRVYLRTKNQEGRWSITQVNEFVVIADIPYPPAPPAPLNIVAAEYFIDTDPGAGLGTPIAITPGTDISNIPVAVNTAGLSDPAFHRLYIRTKNQEGRWSITLDSSFYVGTLVPSWTLEPAGGHDYEHVAVNTTANYNFTIRNTGDAAITLSGATISDPAFTPNFTAGTVIPAHGTLILRVAFKPTTVGAFSGELKITTTTPGVDPVTTNVRGNGFTPATPPVLQYVTAAPYGGTKGVDPAVGQPGLYTYKIVYKSVANKAPQTGFPRVAIDLNGDQDFNDLGEGIFNMLKEEAGTDYTVGVVYSYTFDQDVIGNTKGYQFFATDADGNTANSAYTSGPVVTFNQPDLRIFANDISFSKNNPLPGEAFTVTAKVSNSTANAANNVSVKFYRENTPIDSLIIPVVNGNSSASVTIPLAFEYDGFFPIKVWIDSSNKLGDINVLNNYAIRPITVGSPSLPGGINVTTDIKVQSCPQVRALISGKAVYFGTGTPTPVAGAEVTINTGTLVIRTTTNANGDYSYLLPNTICGSGFIYTVSVTDFTFTSSLLTKAMPIPCTPSTACLPPPDQGGARATVDMSPCKNVVGGNTALKVTLRFRSSDPNNMWRGSDEIKFDTLRIFKNGVQIAQYVSGPNTWAPGNERIVTEFVPLTSTDPVTLKAVMTYTYVEYLQIPGPTYFGRWTKHTVSDSVTFVPESNKPDLTMQSFRQSGFTNFSFQDANIKCTDAGTHTVKVYDSIPNGMSTLVYTKTVTGVEKGASEALGFSKPDMTSGTHILRIIIDTDNAVDEQQEGNNAFDVTVVIPKSDLIVTSFKPSISAIPAGTPVTFRATIKNQGRAAGAFKVEFSVGGVRLGAKKTVVSLAEGASLNLVSDPYTVTTDDKACGITVKVVADSDNEVDESNNNNNGETLVLGTDLKPYQKSGELGSVTNPALVRVNKEGQFFPSIRNIGTRDVTDVTVRYTLNGVRLKGEEIPVVKAGELYAGVGSFTHMFTVPGDYVVQVEADTNNVACEVLENNNTGNFYIRVVDSKEDLEVLSQYISPSSLNPASGQTVTLVGTVRNSGGKASQPNVLRFLVDDIQLGNDVPINSLQPGRDTTVAATATYSSLITGVKVMKIVVDPANTNVEEREDNNLATRTMIVGAAPDLASFGTGAISFNPQGFKAGDSVTISYAIRNKGTQDGSAWVRFLILNPNGGLTAIDSVEVSLTGGASTTVSRKMLFSIEKGKVVAEIVSAAPVEFDLTNNNDELDFSTIIPLAANITVNGDLDMKNGLPGQLPGWIGGKLVLGDHDLVINGRMKNIDADHFIVTNGTGKLKIVNNDAENIYPVGISEGNSNFVKINNAGTPDHFSVGVLPYVLKQGMSGDTVKTAFVNRTWLIEEEVPGGSNATVTFYWNAADEMPLFDRDQARTTHYTTSWQLGDMGMSILDSIGRYRRFQAGFNSFSPFSVTSNSAILPVRLLQFNVAQKGKAAELEWKSDGEINSKHFVVQHSTNGLQFEDIGIVNTNNSAGVHTYRFTHPALSDGTHYYRLKMVDINETFTLSAIKWVQISHQETMRVYPNPAQKLITITGLEANGTVRIVTMDGKLVKQLRSQGTTLVTDVSSLPQGMYVLQYNNHGIQQQLTLIKQ
ncbi:T9SS C-terminal target domain-containing protein [Paraflavitalea soli]|uniref:T9SS C-terminal target domain-containing protein n=1 Tax=Paraflavitalea soli TaxID=2315862 RepID=A0A3B7MN41_9BACT|nr:CARDB domain-containing protein [Paraflavitalea soli]AXY75882.1 T9SS C-terminal target domain-containing protein [Paraflavitalea soli]